MTTTNGDTIEKLKNLALTRCMERIERAKTIPKVSLTPAPSPPPGVTRLLKSRHGLV